MAKAMVDIAGVVSHVEISSSRKALWETWPGAIVDGEINLMSHFPCRGLKEGQWPFEREDRLVGHGPSSRSPVAPSPGLTADSWRHCIK